ncbi:MAG: phosphoribosylglycinamide formyltransferase [Spirochaetes bacterium]|nr:phosphoribosylglycinamide formyltransferase [Spirochaetota bacterium]
MKKTVSFLVSGRGSNFHAVAQAIIKGEIPAHLGIVISDKPGVKALDIARELSIPAFFVNPKDYPTRQDHEKAMVELLNKYKTNLVVTAGYMRLLTPYFVNEFRNRIINIHPALLPSFPGTHAQKQALDYGVKISGCTTHFIDEGTDSGPIIMQRAVPVYDDDTEETLSARILKEEHQILIESVKLFCQDRLTIKGRKVYIVR